MDPGFLRILVELGDEAGIVVRFSHVGVVSVAVTMRFFRLMLLYSTSLLVQKRYSLGVSPEEERLIESESPGPAVFVGITPSSGKDLFGDTETGRDMVTDRGGRTDGNGLLSLSR